ncbi:MAG: hypothetical protein M1830_008665 [Pleopsidium flavum]|nr:MAG: hypothetical protein M1830_008665 [Pleopsidium flavum]
MAAVLSPPFSTAIPSQPRQIPQRPEVRLPSQLPQPRPGILSGHLNLDTFSPVNQNGSFEFDRVLKSGGLKMRTRKTKAWRRVHLVLRPNLISIYKDKNERQLRQFIVLSDLTAVAPSKDPKHKGKHVFCLYSPSRNYHLRAESPVRLQEWVELIRREARIEEEENMVLGSPAAQSAPYQILERPSFSIEDMKRGEEGRLVSSSPEPVDAPPHPSTTKDGIRIPDIKRQSPQNLDYSGNELASYSDFSDIVAPASGFSGASSLSIPRPDGQSTLNADTVASAVPGNQLGNLCTVRNTNHPSAVHLDHDVERVIWHGFLSCLRSKGGVRQWKKLWVVLRPKNLAFYKDEEEYSPYLLIPLSSIISAVEIDPVSKSKRYCMQIIAEEKSYRFSAPTEEALDKWLGALKSQLARRKENGRKRVASYPAP